VTCVKLGQNNLGAGKAGHINVCPNSLLSLGGKTAGELKLDQKSDAGDSKTLVGLSLKNRLNFMIDGLTIDYGWNRRSEGWNDPFYHHFLTFLSILGRDISKLRGKRLIVDNIETDGYIFEAVPGTHPLWRFSWPGAMNANSYMISHYDGAWYERVAAKAFDALNRLNQLRYEAACGVRVQKPDGVSWLTERDVLVATSKAQLYMVSCKTSHKTGLALSRAVGYDIFSETKATAKTLGRFVVPIICSLTEEEPELRDGVLTFGWPLLARPAELAEWIHWAFEAALS
jgi:hypothetical protein